MDFVYLFTGGSAVPLHLVLVGSDTWSSLSEPCKEPMARVRMQWFSGLTVRRALRTMRKRRGSSLCAGTGTSTASTEAPRPSFLHPNATLLVSSTFDLATCIA